MPRSKRRASRPRRSKGRKSPRRMRRSASYGREPLLLTYRPETKEDPAGIPETKKYPAETKKDPAGIPWYTAVGANSEKDVKDTQREVKLLAQDYNDMHVFINQVGKFNIFTPDFVADFKNTHRIRLEQDSEEFKYKHIVISKREVDGKPWDSHVPPFSSQIGGAHLALFTDDGHAMLLFQSDRFGTTKISNGPGGAIERREGFLKTLIEEANQEIGLEIQEYMLHHATVLKVDHIANTSGKPYEVKGLENLPEMKTSVDTYVTMKLVLPRSMADKLMEKFAKTPPDEMDTLAIGLYKYENVETETKLDDKFESEQKLTQLVIRNDFRGKKAAVYKNASFNISGKKLTFSNLTTEVDDKEHEPSGTALQHKNKLCEQDVKVHAKIYPEHHRAYLSIEDNTHDSSGRIKKKYA